MDRLIENIRNNRVSIQEQRAQLDLLGQLNRIHQQQRADEGRLESCIQSFEQASRMQTEATDAFDLSREPYSVLDMYDPDQQARQLILARRLLERGVRMVQVWYGAGFPGIITARSPSASRPPALTSIGHRRFLARPQAARHVR